MGRKLVQCQVIRETTFKILEDKLLLRLNPKSFSKIRLL